MRICIFILSLALASAANARPPNIILIMSDDQGWGDVGFNGNEDIITPNLDAMADKRRAFRPLLCHCTALLTDAWQLPDRTFPFPLRHPRRTHRRDARRRIHHRRGVAQRRATRPVFSASGTWGGSARMRRITRGFFSPPSHAWLTRPTSPPLGQCRPGIR